MISKGMEGDREPGRILACPPDGSSRWFSAAFHRLVKRPFDLSLAAVGLLAISPVWLGLAVAVKISDGGPVFFRQRRIGQGGRPFVILKFRSMIENRQPPGLDLTEKSDVRITRLGRFLRKYKLDELPQLLNVLIGDMSFVGPRPEVPRYVGMYTEEQKKVLALKPGITDLATFAFREEEEMLRRAGQGTLDSSRVSPSTGVEDLRHTSLAVEQFYIKYCLPRKIELSLAYAAGANVWEDTKIILRTICPCLPLRSHWEKRRGMLVTRIDGLALIDEKDKVGRQPF
jgi:lipopolysaccharide/colanic/teichoic acid biosynthesis glycosyltransferase